MFRPIARLSATAAIVALAACDNNPHPKPLQKTRADNSPWVVFNWALTSDPDSLDPQHSYDQQSRRVLEPLYDTLLEYHPLKTDPYEVVPCMLAEMPLPEKAADGRLSYLCKLRPGILFHDDECFRDLSGKSCTIHNAYHGIAFDAEFRLRAPSNATQHPLLGKRKTGRTNSCTISSS